MGVGMSVFQQCVGLAYYFHFDAFSKNRVNGGKKTLEIYSLLNSHTLSMTHMHNNHFLFITNPLRAGQGACYLKIH